VVGEVDFTPTPQGTSFFLFSHVEPSGLRAASTFMAFFCFWIFSSPCFGFVLYVLSKIPLLERLVPFIALLTPYAFGTISYLIFSRMFGFTIGYVGRRVALLFHKSDCFVKWLDKPKTKDVLQQWYFQKIHTFTVRLLTILF